MTHTVFLYELNQLSVFDDEGWRRPPMSLLDRLQKRLQSGADGLLH